jgi:hypothetical protein
MTDFEQYGYSQGQIPVRERYWLLTADFEAFNSGNIATWLMAMRHWANRSRRYRFPFCFFMAMEDVVALRVDAPGAYNEFLESIALLHRSGTRFYTHNHSVFDIETGRCAATPDTNPPEGYTKRRSMFYRAHYVEKVDFTEWVDTLTASYKRFLAEAHLPPPGVLAIRAGGWDYGSSPADLQKYIEALSHAGYGIDSSGCSGVFATPSWRMGTDYQSNVFRLTPNLIEVAANQALDCGHSLERQRSPFEGQSAGPGVYVHVLHFDHLFHERASGAYRVFAVTDHDVIRARIDAFFRTMEDWWKRARPRVATFDDIEFGTGTGDSQDQAGGYLKLITE